MGKEKEFLQGKIGNLKVPESLAENLSKKDLSKIVKQCNDIIIHTADLDNEIKTNPALYHFVSNLYNRAKAAHDTKQIELATQKAELLLEYRRGFQETSKKPTVAEIEALVEVHEDVFQLKEEQVELAQAMNDLFSLREAISKRHTMLKMLKDEYERTMQFQE